MPGMWSGTEPGDADASRRRRCCGRRASVLVGVASALVLLSGLGSLASASDPASDDVITFTCKGAQSTCLTYDLSLTNSGSTITDITLNRGISG